MSLGDMKFSALFLTFGTIVVYLVRCSLSPYYVAHDYISFMQLKCSSYNFVLYYN
jgi:hypothetical protein